MNNNMFGMNENVTQKILGQKKIANINVNYCTQVHVYTWNFEHNCVTSLSLPRSSLLLADANGDPAPFLSATPTPFSGELWTFSIVVAERARISSSCLACGEEGPGRGLSGEPATGERFKKLPQTPFFWGEGFGRTTSTIRMSESWFRDCEWDWVSENCITSDWPSWQLSSVTICRNYTR